MLTAVKAHRIRENPSRFGGIEIDDFSHVGRGVPGAAQTTANIDYLPNVIHDRGSVVTDSGASCSHRNPGALIAGGKVFEVIALAQVSGHKDGPVRSDVQAREERKSLEIGNIYPSAVVEDLRNIIDLMSLIGGWRGPVGKLPERTNTRPSGRVIAVGYQRPLFMIGPGVHLSVKGS